MLSGGYVFVFKFVNKGTLGLMCCMLQFGKLGVVMLL